MIIVSGRTGTSHVTSRQFRQFVEGTLGQGSYIITSGENLEAELASNNSLKIRSGMMSHHGNISAVEIGTYDEVTLTNGTQGTKRIDLVVNRYTRNGETEVESNEWVVIEGAPDADVPAVPEYISGNLQDGDLVDDCPVFKIHYDGINVAEVECLIEVISGVAELSDSLSSVTSEVFTKTINGVSYNVTLYKVGKMVFCRFYGSGAFTDNNATVTNVIPDGYRPAGQEFFVAYNATSANFTSNYGATRYIISPDGSVSALSTEKGKVERHCSMSWVAA